MKKLKIKIFIYLTLAFTFTSIHSYVDYRNWDVSTNFHELPSHQRKLIQANSMAMVVTNPISLFGISYFVGGKPRPRKNSLVMTFTLFGSLVPSSFLWIWLLDGNRELRDRIFSKSSLRN